MAKGKPARFLTVGDVAERLAVSERTVKRMRLRGELKGRLVGGRVRILASSLERYMAAVH